MIKKIKLLLPVVLILWVLSFYVSIKLGIILFVLGLLVILSVIVFLLLNKALKNTNWWNNQYKATEQFISNSGYRDNIIRNFDIVNLGSNPARFAFFYESVKGQSWATGSQGLDMDFQILKYYHSYLKEGGVVLIPIMPFSAISPYLKERPKYWNISYYSKFAKILDNSQSALLPYGNKLHNYLRFPLLYNLHALRYLIMDAPLDNKYYIDYQPMMQMELEQDARRWIKNWLIEFNMKDMSEVKHERWNKYFQEAVELTSSIIDFCIERNLKPVLICVPMTKHLSKFFTDSFHSHMIEEFVYKANKKNVQFLDYTYDERFSDDRLFFNSYFLNLNGRKEFTRQVLMDLNL